jgi:hypothetical protein
METGERRDGDQWRDGKGVTNIKMEMNLDASTVNSEAKIRHVNILHRA